MFRLIIVLATLLFASVAAFNTHSFSTGSRMKLSMGKAIPKKEEWVAVLKSKDIAAGDLVPVEVDGLALLIAADLDGKIFAVANSCPHLGTPLENGR